MANHIKSGAIFVVLCSSVSPGLADEAALSLRESIEQKLELPAQRSLGKIQADTNTEISAFETDGCSGGMSAGWAFVARQFPEFRDIHQESPPWENCCINHDKSYHNGSFGASPEDGFLARLEADKALKTCVSDWAGQRTEFLGETYELTPNQVEAIYAGIANAMFLSVRMGGAPCTGLAWRWGYGWPDCKIDLSD